MDCLQLVKLLYKKGFQLIVPNIIIIQQIPSRILQDVSVYVNIVKDNEFIASTKSITNLISVLEIKNDDETRKLMNVSIFFNVIVDKTVAPLSEVTDEEIDTYILRFQNDSEFKGLT
ncbi:hypothetical protein WA158_006610 [Blastocystis sp. Blastoise]